MEKLYKVEVTCDVINMEHIHVLLGRPWLHNLDVEHHGRANSYKFHWEGKKIKLIPTKPDKGGDNSAGCSLIVVPATEKEELSSFLADFKHAKSV